MKSKGVMMIVLLVLSEVIGVIVGELFHRLYVHAVPPALASSLNMGAAHVAHITYGAGVGLVMFAWALLWMGVGRMSRPGSKSEKGE